MALDRHDMLNRAAVPELGKLEVSYPTPNKRDLIIIERIPLSPKKYVQLPYHSPHPDYDNNGLFLVWQGKVKAENNQVAAIRIYANDLAVNDDWYNASIKYSGDIRTFPVYVRSYIQLREDYDAAAQASKLDRAMRLQVLTEGTYTSEPTVTITPVGAGVAPTARAIMNPGKTKVIALELLTPGSGLVANPTVSFTGGGQTVAATALCEVQDTDVYLVKEETSKLDSEDAHMASLFIKVHRVYESLPGPYQVWDIYDTTDRGAVERKTRSVLATDTTGGAIGAEAAVYTRSGTYPTRTVTKAWYEPRGDSALVLTQFIETWKEVVKRDLVVTSENGGGILERDEREDEPGTIAPAGGLNITEAAQQTEHPHAQKTVTKKLAPESAVPSLELLQGGSGYGPSTPTLIFSGGTCGTAPTGTATLGFPLSGPLVTNGGADYISPPAIEIEGGGGGGGFLVAILGFGVEEVIIDNGGSYTVAPTANFGGDGSGATGNVVLGFGIYFATVTDPGGRAVATLTSDNTNVANNDTVTVGNKVYTFKTTLTPTEGEVLRGASADASLLNLIRAINHTGTPGTDYSCAAANVYVQAASAVTAHAFQVTARQPGTGGNSLATTETSTHLSWGGALMTGGFSYTETPRAIFAGDGVGAAGVIIFGHPVQSIEVTDRGLSYETPPDVNVLVGDGQGLVARSVLAFPLSQINVTTPGTLFSSLPDVVVDLPEDGGIRAIAQAVLTYGIGSATISNGGSGFGSAPAVNFGAGSGTGAAGTAVLGFSVDTAVLDGGGSDYTAFPGFLLAGGGGSGLAVNLRLKLSAVTSISSGGSGYAVNDILDIVGGTHSSVGQVRVTSVGAGGPITETFTYATDGDANGLFYRLGTDFGSIAWTNPHTAGECTFIRSTALAGTDSDFCNRATDYNTTDNNSGEWIAVDIGAGRLMTVSDYLLQNGAQDGLNAPSNWNLQGSNDVATNDITGVNAATWTDIDTRVSDTSIAQTVGSWGHFTLGAVPAQYRFFRILATGVNRQGLNFLQVSELELYGDLDYTSASGNVTGVSVETAGVYSAIASNPVGTTGGGGTGAAFVLAYAVVQVNITNGGSLYTSAPTITIDAPGGGGTTATAHFTLAATGSVKSVTITTLGTDYTAGFALAFSGGGGTGAAGNAVLSSTGVVGSFILTEPGSGYINVPGVTVSGGGGSGATATAVLATSGQVWRVDVILGGVYESPAPTLFLSGGGGSDATISATLDMATYHVHRLHVTQAGRGYTSAATVSFAYADDSVPAGLAATTTLTAAGSIKSVTMVTPGINYTAATVAFVGGTGSGGLGTPVLEIEGSVKSVQIVTPGLYKTNPTLVFHAAQGSGAVATVAHDVLNGSVVELTLVTPGTCTVAPTITFDTGGDGPPDVAATALYHLGTDEWPPNPGFHTDETYGIVIAFIKQVRATGEPHPGRAANCLGRFIDANPYDLWKTLYIASKVNLQTLPCPEIFPLSDIMHLLPVLLSVEVFWTGGVSKLVSEQLASAEAQVSSGANGDILVQYSGGTHKKIVGYGIREWFFGPPPLAYLAAFPLFYQRGASGSVVLSASDSGTKTKRTVAIRDKDTGRIIAGGGLEVSDHYSNQVRALDTREAQVSFFNVISTDKNGSSSQLAQGGTDVLVIHNSQAVNADATSGDAGTTPPSSPVSVGIAALGTPSTLKVSIPSSAPLPDSGTPILWDINVERWRFDVWNATRIYLPMP